LTKFHIAKLWQNFVSALSARCKNNSVQNQYSRVPGHTKTEHIFGLAHHIWFLPSPFVNLLLLSDSVAEPHHFYAAPAPGKNFDAAPAPTLLYSKEKFLK
jgi:hypothetical protein